MAEFQMSANFEVSAYEVIHLDVFAPVIIFKHTTVSLEVAPPGGATPVVMQNDKQPRLPCCLIGDAMALLIGTEGPVSACVPAVTNLTLIPTEMSDSNHIVWLRLEKKPGIFSKMLVQIIRYSDSHACSSPSRSTHHR
jgi:hypothetical protein